MGDVKNIKLDEYNFELSIEEGMLVVVQEGEFKGALRVEPDPPPPEPEPEAPPYVPDTPVLPPGWSIDDKGKARYTSRDDTTIEEETPVNGKDK